MQGSENEASAKALDAEFETRESLGRDNSSGEEYEVPEEVAMLLAMLGNEHAAYWHQRYVRELDEVKFAAQSEDPMENLFVWFGKVQLLLAAQTISSEIVGLDKERACIVDVGCGNGFFCEVLHAMGFRNLTGTDYSPAAVRLCNHVQKHFRKDAREWGTRYVVDNILWTRLEPASFDLVHDSGTLDSIAMTIAEDTPGARGPFDPPQTEAPPPPAEPSHDLPIGDRLHLYQGDGTIGYMRNIARLLKPGGIFFLRSCNHTAEEVGRLVREAGAPLTVMRDVSATGTGVSALLLRCTDPPGPVPAPPSA